MKITQSLILRISFILAISTNAFAQDIITQYGSITGKDDKDSVRYLGIPYAAAPIGENRWTAPKTPKNWNKLNAKEYGASCIQSLSANLKASGNRDTPIGKESEDCLFLNIWTPKTTNKKLPIMVWIHGGANRIGSASNPIYDGNNFARDGVIFVSFNYRLGLFGYFDHKALAGDKDYNGNFGTLDQIAALKWVNENIEAFGGDKNNVTIFGESAGGSAVLTLMTLSESKGLFQKAIVESGGGWQRMKSREDYAKEITTKLGEMGIDENSTIANLKSVPAAVLSQFDSGMGFGAYIDNKLVKQNVAETFAKSEQASVPLIIGSNSNESSLVDRFGINPEIILSNPQTLNLAERVYEGKNLSKTAMARQFFTDSVFAAPAYTIARDHSLNNKTYYYNFYYLAQIMRGRTDGVSHGGEIPYVFENLDKVPRLSSFLAQEDLKQQNIAHSLWVNFAKNGNASTDSLSWQEFKRDKPSLLRFDNINQNLSVDDAAKYETIEKAIIGAK